jgi:hypothetical protein
LKRDTSVTDQIADKGMRTMQRRLKMLRRVALLVATTILSPFCGHALAQDAVMVASTVPGYVPGMVVSSSDRLSIPDGASATLLFQSGEMLRLGGPFEGTLSQQQSTADSGGAAALADMFRTHGVDATVIGGTRSLSRPTDPIDDVQIDAQHSGTYCISQSTSVWITRPSGDNHEYEVRRKGSSRTLGWPTGAARVEWPADVPIEDDSQFEIATDGASHATITFDVMPTDVTRASMVARGIVMGCHDQFDADLHKISRSAVQPELWMTTDHGRSANYHVGDPVTLTITSNADGYLYCAASAKDGSTTPIFPAGAVDGAQLLGSTTLTIPGRRQPVRLLAGADLQTIRCWLADRNITPELPHALLDPPGRRIPDQLAADLAAQFARVGGTRIESDVVHINVD